MKKQFKILVPLLIFIYLIIYLLFFLPEITPFVPGEWTFEQFSILMLMLIFLTGTILAWFKPMVASYIIMFWHLCVWFLSFNFWTESGMVLILAFPGLLLAIVLFTQSQSIKKLTQKTLRKNALGALLINCALAYFIAMGSEIIENGLRFYFHMPYLLLLLGGLIFFIGFWFAIENKFYASIIFIIWYVFLVASGLKYIEVIDQGPVILFGLPVVLIATFYLIMHFESGREKEKIDKDIILF